MMNPLNSEALYSATYVDNYIDSCENLPDDVQRHLSRIRDIDVKYRGCLREVDHYYDLWKSLQNGGDSSQSKRTRASVRMQQNLIAAQELGDEKMQIVNQLQELIDYKTRQLDNNQKNLDIKEDLSGAVPGASDAIKQELEDSPTPPKQSRTQSPLRGVELLGAAVANGGAGCGVLSTAAAERQNSNGSLSCKEQGFSGAFVGNTGGGTTPNSERSGNVSNGASGTALGISNMVSGDNQRSGNKRSRRRNENSAMDMGGNESNSATEGGSNGQERNLQKSSSSSGIVGSANAQKKNTAAGATAGSSASGGASNAATSGNNNNASGGNNNSGKKKKRKTRGAGAGGQSSSAHTNAREETPPPDPIDPDEPTYCVCNQISFGEMILCDNDLCPIEWFHFSCVSLVTKPKGKWFCPNCRGERPNVMKPKAQFLKELERYNKEKEEKT